ncbi:MAG: HD domain-containing protein [Candidatus Omnitrophica bacterium]|nr:HD domain-containing protein [Candidatus Omnitrophota bacterium]
MPGKMEDAFRALLGALQIAKLYKLDHPRLQKAVEKAHACLTAAIGTRDSIVFGIIGEELTCENEIFFELSSSAKQAMDFFKSKGVERMVFSRGVVQDELMEFIRYLAAPKDQVLPPIERYLEAKGVRNLAAGTIKVASATENEEKKTGTRGEDTPAQVYEASLSGVSGGLSGVMSGEVVDALSLRHGVGNILEGLALKSDEFLKLVTLKRYHPTTFVHLLNVATLSMFCASRLGFSREDTLELGIAGLFHDVGKLRLSRGILSKTGSLSNEEFAQIHSHTVFGAETLLEYVDTLGILPVVVAYEHHLKLDLSGYPRSSFNQKPHIASCIVSVCDVYDALNQRRSYKSDFAPDTVYAIMQKDKGRAFEPGILDKFFSFVGGWPVGCLLELSDGRIAVVRRVNEGHIWLPLVETVKPAESRETIDLKEAGGSPAVKRFVNPWREGKELLSLV